MGTLFIGGPGKKDNIKMFSQALRRPFRYGSLNVFEFHVFFYPVLCVLQRRFHERYRLNLSVKKSFLQRFCPRLSKVVRIYSMRLEYVGY